ncbi:hypothetical protein CHLNCDRAFT_94487 [Chlorella variabilis]|uniref:Aminotransferase class I/classII large domain-containing protein n=1 Tax=Chlorella variabilis TaxID=554065 RepID=E1ZDN3_CHLVA|nr:hypothetical protein CHLNCDRAFT_94487 [Chlorella variabilis]EFN55891.1 hypothetical protein CHLNCDRAFT_94487 [Chlorella variabilis]|eukprot:XP_005847993.1 hypothetical protein CHLNCDRAFT_94487 [Chlorella variabilis]
MAQAAGGDRLVAAATAAAARHQQALQPATSQRVLQTDAPCIVKTKKLVATTEGTLSLAQGLPAGIVHWQPPPQALKRAAEMANDPAVSAYGPDEGLPALRDALRRKIREENGLEGVRQAAFTNVVLALLDASDRVVLFKPYYFNHLMAIQMSGGGANVAYGPRYPASGHPDLDWLAGELAGPAPPKMVVITNPCNPTGVLMSAEEVERAAELCAAAGAWLVLDNTYEALHFVYGEGRRHHCVAAPHVINLSSKTQAFGMMGWRMGYIAYPEAGGGGVLAGELLKVQDTIPVCPTQISQYVALGAVEAGRQWVEEQVGGLAGNRAALIDALSPLGTSNIVGGEGAIYLFAKLPDGCEDDDAVVEWLVRRHKVCLIPGSSCGRPGHVRAAYANLKPQLCAEAAARLKAGLRELVEGGMPAVRSFLEQQQQLQ